MLFPGSWNLTFSAAGYRDTTITNIAVAYRQRTDLIVDMSPLPDGIDTIESSNRILLYPNPATSSIRALPPDIINGNINVRIINAAGLSVSSYNTTAVQGLPLVIDLKSLAAGIYTVVFSDISTGTSLSGRFVVIK
jgi:hypothetical protein